MAEDPYQAFIEERVEQLNEMIAPFHYQLTPISPVSRATWTPAGPPVKLALDARVIADIYGVPPWLIDSKHNTRKERWRWRLRYARRVWRWCQRKVRRAAASLR
jgi:hypothetical protein